MAKGMLRDALGLRDGDLVAIVGAGGKTSTAGRLARETIATGRAVVVTSTTRFSVPPSLDLPVTTIPDAAIVEHVLPAALRDAHGCIVAGGATESGRLLGVSDEVIAAIRVVAPGALVIVNADGARMRSLKAPAEHEPVIPAGASLVVALAGLDALGARLDEDTVFRLDLVAEVARQAPGTPITGETIARVLASERGGRKSVPPGTPFAVILNKADDDERRTGGRETAAELNRRGVDRVILAAGMAGDRPFIELVPRP